MVLELSFKRGFQHRAKLGTLFLDGQSLPCASWSIGPKEFMAQCPRAGRARQTCIVAARLTRYKFCKQPTWLMDYWSTGLVAGWLKRQRNRKVRMWEADSRSEQKSRNLEQHTEMMRERAHGTTPVTDRHRLSNMATV